MLLRHFERNRADFNRFSKTVYPVIKKYYRGDKLYLPLPEVVHRVEAQPGYSRFMRKFGISNFSFWRIDNEHTGFFLTVDTTYFYTYKKGYAYLPVPPTDDLSSVVVNIDEVEIEALSETHRYFKHIEGNWYLFLVIVQ